MKKPKMLEYLPTQFKRDVFFAVATADYVKLRNLLSMDAQTQIVTRSQEYTVADCSKLYKVMLSSKLDNYTNKHDDFIHVLRALLADRRTSQLVNGLIRCLLEDKRDLGDVIEAVLDRAPELCCDLMLETGIIVAMLGGKHRVLDCLINRPGYNVNKAAPIEDDELGERLLHLTVTAVGLAPNMRYNPQLLPVVLRHPLLMPNLRQKYEINEEIVYRTALAVADDQYANAIDYLGTPQAVTKKRAARNVHLLLADDRVDVHDLECIADTGYWGLLIGVVLWWVAQYEASGTCYLNYTPSYEYLQNNFVVHLPVLKSSRVPIQHALHAHSQIYYFMFTRFWEWNCHSNLGYLRHGKLVRKRFLASGAT